MAAPASSLRYASAARWVPLLVAPALVAYLLPGMGAAMMYDRSAILAGESWRLVTGHWVHFSASHLLWDALVLAVTGWLIESRAYRHFVLLSLLSALAIGLVMLISLPDMATYGGLSGIAMASTVYLALHGWREAGPGRAMWLAILLLCAGRLLLDTWLVQFSVVRIDDPHVVPVPASHFIGAATGLLVYLWSIAKNRLCGGS